MRLTDALGWALAQTRERRSAHDPGRALCALAVMLAGGGHCGRTDPVARSLRFAIACMPRSGNTPGGLTR